MFLTKMKEKWRQIWIIMNIANPFSIPDSLHNNQRLTRSSDCLTIFFLPTGNHGENYLETKLTPRSLVSSNLLASSCPEWAGTSVMGMDAHPFSEGKCEVFVENRRRKIRRSEFPDRN
jgi:hypothetical protein